MEKPLFWICGRATLVACAVLLVSLFLVPTAPASEYDSSRVTFNLRPAVRLLPDGRILSNVAVGFTENGCMITVFPL